MNANKLCRECGQAECRECATCGQMECDHHEFVAVNRPPHCVCNAMEWADPTKIPPVCAKHEGNPTKECAVCGHDYFCHRQEINQR